MAEIVDRPPAATEKSSGRSHNAEVLRVTELFVSLQGEARDAGAVTTFIRLTGCPLRCRYCDTAYAFHGGQRWSLADIIARCEYNGACYVCVTGGEPLAQPNTARLVKTLCDAGYQVSVETSGALDIRTVDVRASRIVDIKTPGSGEAKRNDWRNIAALTPHDQLKFVLCSRADYDWARQRLAELSLPAGCGIWLSPSAGELEPARLADWMVADRVGARLQLQLHKQLWGDQPGR